MRMPNIIRKLKKELKELVEHPRVEMEKGERNIERIRALVRTRPAELKLSPIEKEVGIVGKKHHIWLIDDKEATSVPDEIWQALCEKQDEIVGNQFEAVMQHRIVNEVVRLKLAERILEQGDVYEDIDPGRRHWVNVRNLEDETFLAFDLTARSRIGRKRADIDILAVRAKTETELLARLEKIYIDPQAAPAS